MTGPRMDHRLAARDVADMPVMMDACMAMNVRFLVCENSLKEEGLTSDDLVVANPSREITAGMRVTTTAR